MHPRRTLVLGVTLALVALLGVSVASPAVGGPKLLTLSKAKKVFVTKKKANKTFVTKAEAAAFLTTASADARYLPRASEVRVPVPTGGWELADSTTNVLVVHNEVHSVVQKNASPANDVDFFSQVPVPTVIGGAALNVTGLELCFSIPDAALAPPVIDRIALQRGARSAAVPVPTTLTTVAADETGRVDSACATVSFAPVTLLPTDVVGVGIRIDYAEAPTQVLLGAGSLILRS
jgi:hypothetical protein